MQYRATWVPPKKGLYRGRSLVGNFPSSRIDKYVFKQMHIISKIILSNISFIKKLKDIFSFYIYSLIFEIKY